MVISQDVCVGAETIPAAASGGHNDNDGDGEEDSVKDDADDCDVVDDDDHDDADDNDDDAMTSIVIYTYRDEYFSYEHVSRISYRNFSPWHIALYGIISSVFCHGLEID